MCHQQDAQSQIIQRLFVIAFDLMPIRKKNSKNTAKNMALQEAKLFVRQYICFWVKNKEQGRNLGGRGPVPCNLTFTEGANIITRTFC